MKSAHYIFIFLLIFYYTCIMREKIKLIFKCKVKLWIEHFLYLIQNRKVKSLNELVTVPSCTWWWGWWRRRRRLSPNQFLLKMGQKGVNSVPCEGPKRWVSTLSSWEHSCRIHHQQHILQGLRNCFILSCRSLLICWLQPHYRY